MGKAKKKEGGRRGGESDGETEMKEGKDESRVSRTAVKGCYCGREETAPRTALKDVIAALLQVKPATSICN